MLSKIDSLALSWMISGFGLAMSSASCTWCETKVQSRQDVQQLTAKKLFPREKNPEIILLAEFRWSCLGPANTHDGVCAPRVATRS
jgi:hypothetical protein